MLDIYINIYMTTNMCRAEWYKHFRVILNFRQDSHVLSDNDEQKIVLFYKKLKDCLEFPEKCNFLL